MILDKAEVVEIDRMPKDATVTPSQLQDHFHQLTGESKGRRDNHLSLV
jgi:hypothetical protein